MEIKKKKCILLEDEATDWLEICTAASSLDVKGKQAINKKFVFLANRLVIPNMVTYTCTKYLMGIIWSFFFLAVADAHF